LFNREYQIRSARRAIIAEIAKGYYRPAERPLVRGVDHIRSISRDRRLGPVEQLPLPFPMSEQELAEDFESTFQ
jgi:hypothetical protein